MSSASVLEGSAASLGGPEGLALGLGEGISQVLRLDSVQGYLCRARLFVLHQEVSEH